MSVITLNINQCPPFILPVKFVSDMCQGQALCSRVTVNANKLQSWASLVHLSRKRRKVVWWKVNTISIHRIVRARNWTHTQEGKQPGMKAQSNVKSWLVKDGILVLQILDDLLLCQDCILLQVPIIRFMLKRQWRRLKFLPSMKITKCIISMVITSYFPCYNWSDWSNYIPRSVWNLLSMEALTTNHCIKCWYGPSGVTISAYYIFIKLSK